MVGDQKNCRELLTRDYCVLVFPEGVRGSGKTIFERYQLQRMGTGFVRMALETKAPIVPVAVIGCEEAFPAILNFKPLAKLLRAPYFPVTPFFPWLGLLGMIPLPVKVILRFGEPITFDQSPEITETEAEALVEQVREKLQAEINEGVRQRGDKLFTGGEDA
jgi:1-acyl-sn-glycerol-3-phosphate acyltransferase